MDKIRNKISLSRYLLLLLMLPAWFQLQAQKTGVQWSTEKAWNWYKSNPWICGFNYIPASAINYTAMWDKTGFTADEIDRELALAATTGFNAVRVVLQFVVWEDNPVYFKEVFSRFLAICRKHNMKVMPAFFDDCVFGANVDPAAGRQPEPLEGWYAWAWSPSPGHSMVLDTTTYPRLERYIRDIIGTYRKDPAILAWDLYNEPTNGGLGLKSLPLVRRVFKWAREINPSQPLTIALWGDIAGKPELNEIILTNSDIITFHSYNPKEAVEKLIHWLKEYNRPIICTEWMKRQQGSNPESLLPLFFNENVGCMHWGLVNGKTQTHLPSRYRPGDMPYRGIWQHDLYTSDYKMYSPYEMQLFKSYISKSKTR